MPGLGVNIHTTAPSPGEAALIRSTGFGTVRMDLHWHDTETRPGHYDFSPYDRLVAGLQASRIRPLLILNYGHPYYDGGRAPASAAARAAFAKWAAAAAARFKGRGILWEIYNEPNLGHFWSPAPDAAAYVALVSETAEAIRAAAPGETIIGPASSGVDLAFLEACFNLGLLRHLDAVTVHPYRHHEPESVVVDYRRLRSLIARYAPAGREIPVLCGEWGYSAAWDGFDERRQALMLTRLFLTNAAARIPLTIWYDWRNDGVLPSESEHNFGLITHSGAPKPAWQAAAAMARELDGFGFHMRLETGHADEFVLLFRSDSGVRLAAWTTSPGGRRIELPVSAGAFRAAGWLGDERGIIHAAETGLDLELNDEPVFLEPLGPNAALELAARWDALPHTLRAHAPASIQLKTNLATATFPVLRNEGGRELALELSLGSDRAWRQSAWLEVANPVEFTLTPHAVRLGKPEGEALAARLSAVLEQGTHEEEVALPAEELSRWIALPQMSASVRALLLDAEGTVLASLPETRFTAAGSASETHLVHDGDPRVAASAAVTAECAPGAPADGCSTIELDLGAGKRFLRLEPRLPGRNVIPAGATALGAWVHGDASAAYLRLRFTDSTSRTFQPAGISVTWRGWRWAEIPISGGGARLASWGGAADGPPKGDLIVDTLLLIDKPGPEPLRGSISVASMVWISR